MVVFSAVVALCATGLGIITCIRAVSTTNALSHDCASGAASKARQLQETSDRLVRFQLHCQASAGNINKQLIHCPDFEKTFQNESGYVSYLMRLEKYETCTGFCKPARALSIRDKIKPHPATSNGQGHNISHHPHDSFEGTTESDAEPAAVVIGGCSEVVWQRILFASLWIGVSSIVGGLILAGGVTSSLALILMKMLDVCIKINLLQAMDSQLLLRAARMASFDESNTDASKQNGVVRLLTLLHQEISNFDCRQALFGFPITVAVRNTLCLSMIAALSSYVWEAMPILGQIDLHDLVTKTVMTE